MMKSWYYLKYLIKHKWFVFKAGEKIGVNYWQLLIHDWTKFLPSEWYPYLEYFYNVKSDTGEVRQRFQEAWLYHQRRNKHHWQYWVLIQDSGEVITLPIPYEYMLEMVADWVGAGEAINGKQDVNGWYNKNKDKILLHPVTRLQVEFLIKRYFSDGN